MKQYLPHLFILFGILIFFNGALVVAYSGSVIAAILPLIGVAVAVFGLLRLRSKSISD